MPSAEKAVAKVKASNEVAAFSQTKENVQLLKDTLSSSGTNLSDSELGLFLYQATKTGLDPLAKQIYVMKSGSKVSFMTSIDGQRLVAQRTGEYEGQTPVEWCGQDGKWKEVWLENGPPAAARVGVYRKGMREPVYGVATWKSYNQGRGVWNDKGDVMIAKCAEALALRKAFPQELSGLYTSEEMAENGVPEEDRPQPMTFQEALGKSMSSLKDKGISTREDCLAIIYGVAGVTSIKDLKATMMNKVMKTIEEEPIEDLKKMYVPEAPTHLEGEVIADGQTSMTGDLHTHDLPPKQQPVQERNENPNSSVPTSEDGTMPDNFLVDDDPITEEDIERSNNQQAAKLGKEQLVSPDFKPTTSGMIRIEMRKFIKELYPRLGITTPTQQQNFNKSAIGDPEPKDFDQAKMLIDLMIDEINSVEGDV